jgi:soluble lytic murein transglycosylase-like protein
MALHGLVGLGLAAWGAGPAWALDAQSCAALREQGGKFALGMAACQPLGPRAAAAGPSLLPRAAQAQQMHLFERHTPSDAATAGSAPPAALPSHSPVSTPARRSRSGTPAIKPAAQSPQSPQTTQTTRMPTALRRAIELAPAVERGAADHAIDPLLLHAIARVESRHNPEAISPAGARGLMQVMPATGARFGVGLPAALHDANTSLEVSARYLRVLNTRFKGQLPLVLAAYNAGEGAVEKHGRRIPPYAETQAYVRSVLTEYQRLQTALDGNAAD